MNSKTRTNLDNLRSEDSELQNEAFFFVLEATNKPIDWAHQVKDEKVKVKALELIASEGDLKYRKRYAGVWKKTYDNITP